MRYKGLEWIYLDEKRPVASSCEYGNEFSDCLEGDKFLDKLCDCELLRETHQKGAGFTWLIRDMRRRNLVVA
jgi:hypothetical protein